MYLKEANEILRKAIIKEYFQPELEKNGYVKIDVKHPLLEGEGLSRDKTLYIYFDIITGSDYPDGDDWFIVEYLLPFEIDLPDELKSPDYFTTISLGKGKHYWKHRELVRYKYGKVKRFDEALNFIRRNAEELYKALVKASVTEQIDKERKEASKGSLS